MFVFTVVVVKLLCTAWLVEAQPEEAMVYVGTGVNGSVENRDNSDVLVLGGLFPVHRRDDSMCGDILDLGVQRLEAICLLYTSPSPRDQRGSRMPSSA